MSEANWSPVEPDFATAFARFDSPLEALAHAEIPAIILRNAWPAEACRQLVDLLIAEDLLFEPAGPVPEKFQQQAIPEGYYREGRSTMPTQAWHTGGDDEPDRLRIDIGTSLGYRGSDPDAFFAHSAATNEQFDRLFTNRDNTIGLLYDSLQTLSRGKRARTAHEPDGREYGRAIIRAHYGGYTYRPHFDSVRLRERRDEYSVSTFDHQFAGVLVLQNSTLAGQSPHTILHRCLWTEEVDPHLKADTFHDYAREHGLGHATISLEPGDLYFFNTRLIHEVPGVAGPLPRIVLATFIGYSSDRDEMFVWS